MIGRTPLKPFDPSRRTVPDEAGDSVQFFAIDRAISNARSHGRLAHGVARRRVIRPGMLTTVQDLGRWGFQARGVPVAGPMDPVSHRLANALVGNGRDAAALEITLLGPGARIRGRAASPLTGAEFELSLDGRPRAVERAVHRARRVVGCASARRSAGRARTWRVAGGIAVPPVLGSRATHVVERDGRMSTAARCGAAIVCRLGRRVLGGSAPARRRTAESCLCPARTRLVRVLPGPQLDYFAPDALDALQSAPYTIAQQFGSHGISARGAAADARARRRHHLRRDAARRAAGAGIGPADPADGRSADHRRLSEDRDGDRAPTWPSPGSWRRATRSRFVVCTPREALAALIAQERALMALEGRDA